VRNWKLAALLIGLLAGPANACDPKQVDRGSEAWQQFTAPAKRLAGRVLGSFVREGMIEEQVQDILGRDDGFPTGGVAGGILFFTKEYSELGLSVSFIGEGGRPTCVRSVSYWPLLER
jgi:hypothetical protein